MDCNVQSVKARSALAKRSLLIGDAIEVGAAFALAVGVAEGARCEIW
jgi:hypothetical protein